jgi:Zn-dependent peptidase ImmA (M78 family)
MGIVIQPQLPNTNMIVLAREARGLSQKELANKINMSPTNLSKIERGEIGLGNDVLQLIAEETEFPIHFFSQSGTIIPENLAYRKRQSVSQKIITPIQARINILCRHVQFITQALPVIAPDFPKMQVTESQSPSKIAQKLRQKWDIKEPVIENITRLGELHQIPVLSFDFGTDRIDSRTMLTEDQYPIIFINKRLQGDKLRFSIAYELGQLIMHTYFSIGADRDISHEANAFAAELLMPSKEIKKDFEQGISIPVLAQLKKKWKVSMIALLYRADDLGFLSPNQKRYLLQQFNTLHIRRREPQELDIPIEKPQLMKKWISEYRKRKKLGTVEMAALLYLFADEFMEIYN